MLNGWPTKSKPSTKSGDSSPGGKENAMQSKLTIEDARELARKACAMVHAAKNSKHGECGERKGDFMWLLFTLAGVRGTENIIEEIKAAEKAVE